MRICALILVLTSCVASAQEGGAAQGTAASASAPIEASTASGDRVLLHPDGRWEYVDEKKAEAARKLAETLPGGRTRPVEAQGGLFGVGRTLMPGDKDYNRGSLNPKLR